MVDAYTRLVRLKRSIASEYWAERLFAELEYAVKMAVLPEQNLVGGTVPLLNGEGEALLLAVAKQLDTIETETRKERVVTQRLVSSVESALAGYTDLLKKPVLHLAGHAHIDINWMWGWQETVSITLETFRTVLMLMKQFPHFVFSQSQAALYRIVEEYEPEMLSEIGRRIRQGRWEITAAMWSEADMNMISGESLVRHLLYSKQYLQNLFSLDDDNFQVAFQPDTFGHSANVPEILAEGGVKYYYHCRGASDQHIYRWKAPSGKSVLTYRETKWYNDPVHYSMFSTIPEFIRRYGYDRILAVYGVGDHGGGPTRRDLSRIQDMQSWPLAPTLRTGTYREYFTGLNSFQAIPEVAAERNVIFSGCYSSQSRIKRANKLSEKNLYETELWQSISLLTGKGTSENLRDSREQTALAQGWKRTMVSQFHDILPGSGTVDTKDFALGEFQKTLASALSIRTSLYRRLVTGPNGTAAENKKNNPEINATAFGSGVGFGNDRAITAAVERGSGDKRLITLFNSLSFSRKAYPVITLWDWEFPGEETEFIYADEFSDEQRIPSQLLNSGKDNYWQHNYSLFVLEAEMPAVGYRDIYAVSKNRKIPESEFHSYGVEGWLVENEQELVLENDFLRVRFDRENGRVVSCSSKATGDEYINSSGAGFQYLIEERDRKYMSSWIEGAFIGEKEADKVFLSDDAGFRKGEVQSSCTFSYRYGSSEVRAVYRLNKGEPFLRCEAAVVWREFGSEVSGIPRLRYQVPLAFSGSQVVHDRMNGVFSRQPVRQDLAAGSFSAALGESLGCMIVSQEGYGYRLDGDVLSLNLLRSSIDPDPAPEAGDHRFNFILMPLPEVNIKRSELLRLSQSFIHGTEWISRGLDEGETEGGGSFLSILEGSACLGAIKRGESFTGIVLRFFDVDGKDQRVTVRLGGKIETAAAGDLHEIPLAQEDPRFFSVEADISAGTISWQHPAYATCTLLVRFDRE
jgi:alpha-mannosidase